MNWFTPEMPHENGDTLVARRDEKDVMLSYCLEMGRGFHFLKKERQQFYYSTKERYYFDDK